MNNDDVIYLAVLFFDGSLFEYIFSLMTSCLRHHVVEGPSAATMRSWEINYAELALLSEAGEGFYGAVYKGKRREREERRRGEEKKGREEKEKKKKKRRGEEEKREQKRKTSKITISIFGFIEIN